MTFLKAVQGLLLDSPAEAMKSAEAVEEIRRLGKVVADKPLNQLSNCMLQQSFWDGKVKEFISMSLKMRIHMPRLTAVRAYLSNFEMKKDGPSDEMLSGFTTIVKDIAFLEEELEVASVKELHAQAVRCGHSLVSLVATSAVRCRDAMQH